MNKKILIVFGVVAIIILSSIIYSDEEKVYGLSQWIFPISLPQNLINYIINNHDIIINMTANSARGITDAWVNTTMFMNDDVKYKKFLRFQDDLLGAFKSARAMTYVFPDEKPTPLCMRDLVDLDTIYGIYIQNASWVAYVNDSRCVTLIE